MKATRSSAKKILKVMSHGLCKGVGNPIPGEMCILAVKRYVFGLSHGDELKGLPIGAAVRSFDIALNDCDWSSNQVRARGMSRLAVAEFGSDEIDQNVFVKELVLATVRKVIPIALRAAAKMQSSEAHKTELEKQASACEEVSNLAAASDASYAARAAASDAASDAARAASYAASDAARAASYAAARAASYAAASDASYAARAAASYAARAAASDAAARAASDAAASDASYAARAAASDAARAASYAAASDASDAASDEVLSIMAECGVEALIACKSYGCEWLDLAA